MLPGLGGLFVLAFLSRRKREELQAGVCPAELGSNGKIVLKVKIALKDSVT